MHRQNSIQPYNRHYTHTHIGFLDYLEPKEDGTVQGSLKKMLWCQDYLFTWYF